MLGTICESTCTLGVEDEARCQLELGHEGDHFQTWTTINPPREQIEIRWRELREAESR